MTGAPLVLVAGCALVAGLVGLGVPRLVASLPRAAAPPGDPEPAEPARPTYAAVAAQPHLAVVSALTSALAAALVASSVGARWSLVGLVPLVPLGVALAIVDARTRLLPRVLVLPATGVLLGLAVVGALAAGEPDDLVRAVLGLLLGRSVLWLLWFVRPAGMGFGDVRLAALLGLALGYLGWPELLVGLYAGFLLFGVPGALLALVRRDAALLRTAYPFGPFLLGGALLGIVLGDPVARALGWA